MRTIQFQSEIYLQDDLSVNVACNHHQCDYFNDGYFTLLKLKANWFRCCCSEHEFEIYLTSNLYRDYFPLHFLGYPHPYLAGGNPPPPPPQEGPCDQSLGSPLERTWDHWKYYGDGNGVNPPPPQVWTDRHLWKQYLPVVLRTRGGKYTRSRPFRELHCKAF